MNKIKQGKIKDLILDPQNANRGTERGNQALEESLQRYGAGRSVLADKNGVIIAGNKTVEKASEIGINDVVIVPTRGDQLVVVMREDLDLSKDPEARALAIADNRVGELDLDWDVPALVESVKNLDALEPFFYQEEIDNLLASAADSILLEEDTKEDVSNGPAIVAKLTIPPRAWLIDRNEIVKAFEQLCERFGIKIEWPD